ncbi:ATP-dependent DNA ligase [Mesorhizobium sp. 10J20-29]
MLNFIAPMMPTLVDEPPEAGDWIHEVKYDGYRTQIIVENGTARAFTRNGYDWSLKYPYIVRQAAMLRCVSAIIDGEVILPNHAGASDFHGLRSAIKARPESLAFVAFDLLHLDGADLRYRPLIERRESLARLVEPANGYIQFSHHVSGGGAAFYRAIDSLHLEGMVSKRPDSQYRSGRSRNWFKVKCYTETDYEIAGVLRQRGSAPLAIMTTLDGNPTYVGSAIVALNSKMREQLWKRVKEGSGPAPKGVKKNAAEWLTPGLVGRVRHLKGEDKLRHATLKDFRKG